MKRIYHTWDKWECFPSGFYNPKPPKKGLTSEKCKQMYADFLSDPKLFREYAMKVISEWKYSCEHYLTNDRMNRIAWIGQSAMCLYSGVSKFFCGGFFLLTQNQQDFADSVALDVLNVWMKNNGYNELTMQEARGKTKADLY